MVDIDVSFVALVLLLGFAISLLSGYLGIGGGIVMAPALLYLPPLLGLGTLDMKQVTGLTITHALFASLSGVFRHHRQRHVNRQLIAWMGGSIVVGGLSGALLSQWISSRLLMAIFAALALVAAALMFLPRPGVVEECDADACEFNRSLAIFIALAVGLFGGMIGQGGSFILIPLMLYVLRLPTRVVIGSNLGLVFLASLAGFAGKLSTGQVPLVLAAILITGALPGARIGSVLSQQTRPVWLRLALAVIIAVSALGISIDVMMQK